jgi:hypothetical protein
MIILYLNDSNKINGSIPVKLSQVRRKQKKKYYGDTKKNFIVWMKPVILSPKKHLTANWKHRTEKKRISGSNLPHLSTAEPSPTPSPAAKLHPPVRLRVIFQLIAL